MKSKGGILSFKSSFQLLSVCLCLGLWAGAGCWNKPAPPAAPTQAATPPKPEPVIVEKTSFNEVTSHLDPGGSLFAYMSMAQWCQGMANTVDGWREFALGLPMAGPNEKAMITNVFALATPLIRKSGIEDLSGVGLSGIAIGNGLYRTRFIAHHYPGKGNGFLWTVAGKAPHNLTGLGMLPSETVMAAFSDLDLGLLWDAIDQTVNQSGITGARDALRQFTAAFEKNTGLAWQPLIASVGDEYGVMLTLDPERKISIPLPGGTPLNLPEPGLVLVVHVKSDLLFDRIDQLLKENPQTVSVDKPGLKMRTLPVPLPLPIVLRPTIARSGEFLYLASTDDLMQRVLDTQSGKRPGLQGTEEFKKLSQGIPLQGNQFTCVSQRFGEVMSTVQTAMLQAGGGAGQSGALMQKFMVPLKSPQSFSVASNDKEGWSMVSNMNQEPGTALHLPAAVVPAAIGAGMLLPALAQAKERAISISCVNNLKQIGLAARIWATDHNDNYPMDFLSMTNELVSPRILVCPAAGNSAQASNLTWSSLNVSDITYQMVGGGGKEDPKSMGDVFVRCPIHGHVCHRDGSVQQGSGK